MITPYRDNGNLGNTEKVFNRAHAGTRSTVERAFGLLKGKWRRLQNLEVLNVKYACNIVGASCILHNLLLNSEGAVEEEFIEEDEIDNVINEAATEAGRTKRQYLTDLIAAI